MISWDPLKDLFSVGGKVGERGLWCFIFHITINTSDNLFKATQGPQATPEFTGRNQRTAGILPNPDSV